MGMSVSGAGNSAALSQALELAKANNPTGIAAIQKVQAQVSAQKPLATEGKVGTRVNTTA